MWARIAIPLSVWPPFIPADALSCLGAASLTSSLTRKYCSCSHPLASHLSFSPSDLCYISTTHSLLFVSCLLRYDDGQKAPVPLTLLYHWALPILSLSLSLSLQLCQSLQTFALDTVDSMVRCGILIIKEEEGVRWIYFFLQKHCII